MGAQAQPLLKLSENQGLEALTFKPCPQALFKVKGWVPSSLWGEAAEDR